MGGPSISHECNGYGGSEKNVPGINFELWESNSARRSESYGCEKTLSPNLMHSVVRHHGGYPPETIHVVKERRRAFGTLHNCLKLVFKVEVQWPYRVNK